MLKMVQDNYLAASNTIWDAWTESEIRAWLIEHGYMRTDAQVKRDELVGLINAKCVLTPLRTLELLILIIDTPILLTEPLNTSLGLMHVFARISACTVSPNLNSQLPVPDSSMRSESVMSSLKTESMR